MRLFIFLWNFEIGGVQKHSVLLANHLVSINVQVSIIYSEQRGELLKELDERITLIQFKVKNSNSPVYAYRLGKKLSSIIPTGANIVCNGSNNFRQLSRVNFFTQRWHLIHILHNDLSFTSGFKGWFNKAEMKILIKNPRVKLIALSSAQKLKHEKILSIKSIQIIPNFIKINHTIKPKLKVKKELVKGIAIGRYSKEKGYDILVSCLSLLKQPVQIDVFGSGEQARKVLIEEAEKKGVPNIRFHREINDPVAYLLQYDFLILPSLRETFGIVILEALSCGIPVLSTDCDGPLDLIHESNGVIVKKNLPEALAAGIKRICDNIMNDYYDPTSIRMGVERYSVESAVDMYLSILK